MKKWYRKPLIKTVLVLLAIASVTMLMISTVLLAAFSGNLFQKETWSLNKPEYAASKTVLIISIVTLAIASNTSTVFIRDVYKRQD